MAKGIKIAGSVLLAVLVLVLLTVRFAPGLLLDAADAAISGTSIDATDVQTEFWPLRLRTVALEVISGSAHVSATDVDASVHVTDWIAGEPFWTVSSSVVVVKTEPATEPDAQADEAFAVPDLAPLLTLQSVTVEQLSVEAVDLQIALSASTQDRHLALEVKGTLAGDPLAVRLTLSENLALESEFSADVGFMSYAGGVAAQLSTGEDFSVRSSDSRVEIVRAGVPLEKLTNIAGNITLGATGAVTIDTLSADYFWGTSAESIPFTLSGSVGDSFDVRSSLGDADLALQGTLLDTGIAARVDLEARSLPPFFDPAPYTEGDVLPLTVRADVRVDGDNYQLAELAVSSPGNVLSGTADIAVGETFRIVADLAAERIYVPLLAAEPAAEEGAADEALDETETGAEADALPLFSDEPFDLSDVVGHVVDVKISAAQLFVQDAEFRDFSLIVETDDDGRLSAPLSGQLGEGGFDGRFGAGMNDTGGFDSSFAFTLTGVALESFGLLPGDELSGGSLDIDVDLATSGGSAAQLAGNLNGRATLMVEDATLKNDLVEAVGSDVLLETLNKLNPFRQEDPATDLSCGLVRFDVVDGTMVSNGEIVAETSKMEIVGDAKIVLPSEELDVTFSPTAKEGVGLNIGSLVKFVKLGGTLRDPTPEVDALGVLQTGAAVGAALSTGGVSIVAESLAKRVATAGSACDRVREGGTVDTETVSDSGTEAENGQAVAEESGGDAPAVEDE